MFWLFVQSMYFAVVLAILLRATFHGWRAKGAGKEARMSLLVGILAFAIAVVVRATSILDNAPAEGLVIALLLSLGFALGLGARVLFKDEYEPRGPAGKLAKPASMRKMIFGRD